MTLKYTIAFAPELTSVRLVGTIDEHVGDTLTEIRPQIRTRRAVFDCEHVTLINSVGVSIWLAHIRAYADLEFGYINCPYPFTSLCLIIPDLPGDGKVQSLFVRYYCTHCDKGEYQTVLAERDETLQLGRFKDVPCAHCRRPLAVEPDDADFIDVFRGDSEA